MSNFTPGPWEVFIYDWGLNPYKNLLGDYAIKRKPEEPLIAYALNLADARLIAAAPEMKDVIAELLPYVSLWIVNSPKAKRFDDARIKGGMLLERCDALLRRIEGEDG